jgi:hypothetical protein
MNAEQHNRTLQSDLPEKRHWDDNESAIRGTSVEGNRKRYVRRVIDQSLNVFTGEHAEMRRRWICNNNSNRNDCLAQAHLRNKRKEFNVI